MSSVVDSVGTPSCGSLCDKTELQDSVVRKSSRRQVRFSDRRLVFRMGQSVGVCLSSSKSDSEDLKQAQVLKQSRVDSHSSPLASEGVVSRVTPLPLRSSKVPSVLGKAAKSAPSEQVSPKCSAARPSRLAIIERSLKNRGFSSKVAFMIARPIRLSSQRLYQSKWEVFLHWCLQRKEDPDEATLSLIAKFFLFLREKKGLSSIAIKGYRAALSPIFILRGIDLSNTPEISTLMRNFDLEMPRVSMKPPMWDLSLVLLSLKRKPYEPLSKCPRNLLSIKTAFLLALASAKRVGELHAVSYRFSHTSGWAKVTLTTVPSFVAKTLDPGVREVITIPSLSSILTQDDEDASLCPVRALREYSKRTEHLRPKCERLFVSNSDKTVSKNSISRWIREAVL